MARGSSGGRIHPSSRRADDTTAILGNDIQILEEHNDSIVSTEKKSMNDKTRKDYNNKHSNCCIPCIYWYDDASSCVVALVALVSWSSLPNIVSALLCMVDCYVYFVSLHFLSRHYCDSQ